MATDVQELGVKAEAPEAPAALPVNVTAKAVAEVKSIIASTQTPETAGKLFLRLSVVGGGCSGFKNKLDLDTNLNEKLDEVFDVDGLKIVIDKRSKLYIAGATVDFHDDLNQRGFSVTNPNAKSTCGCGSSYSM